MKAEVLIVWIALLIGGFAARAFYLVVKRLRRRSRREIVRRRVVEAPNVDYSFFEYQHNGQVWMIRCTKTKDRKYILPFLFNGKPVIREKIADARAACAPLFKKTENAQTLQALRERGHVQLTSAGGRIVIA